MKVYNLAGKKVIVHENELFVQAEGLVGVEVSGGGEQPEAPTKKSYYLQNKEKVKKVATPVGNKTGKSKRLDPQTKAALIAELEAGDKTIAKLAAEYKMAVSGVHYVKKGAGLMSSSVSPSMKGKPNKKDGPGFIKKNFQCGCGKAFSASTTGVPGEMISCPDCEDQILASDGEEI